MGGKSGPGSKAASWGSWSRRGGGMLDQIRKGVVFLYLVCSIGFVGIS